MKKINYLIITFIIILNINNTYAKDWYLENILDLNYWIVEYKLNLSNIDYIYFENIKYNQIYKKIKQVDSLLKNEFIKKYRKWKYEYYQTNWIITNYNNFIYHTNMFLKFLNIKEKNHNYREINSAILKSYTDMRSSYKKVKNIVKWY